MFVVNNRWFVIVRKMFCSFFYNYYLYYQVTHIIYSPPLLAPCVSLIFLAECLMFERDAAIWNRKKFEKRPLLVKEDKSILAYRRWYAQFYSQHSPSYHSAIKSLQW